MGRRSLTRDGFSIYPSEAGSTLPEKGRFLLPGSGDLPELRRVLDPRGVRYLTGVNYDEFRSAWIAALARSQLPKFTGHEESLDLRCLDRKYASHVEPLGGQDAAPFHVTAKLSWTWDALHTARSATIEEDVVTEMFGRGGHNVTTKNPWLRVDVEFRATSPYDKPFPMPSTRAWRAWVTESMSRVVVTEPLVPEQTTRVNEVGMTECLAWMGDPEVIAKCDPEGRLLLTKVKLDAWASIVLPRQLDCPDQEDDPPDEQLDGFFSRVRAALYAWMQSLDHLGRVSPN